MTNTMKNTLKSVLVLSAISVVCVAILALCNAFIPKYKPSLDMATAALINKISPTGVSDEEALKGNYFSMHEFKGTELDDFNKKNGAESNNKVLAVYNVVKGPQAGTVAVEAQAQGYGGNDPIIMLTSFNKDSSVLSTVVKSQNENSPGTDGIFVEKYFAKFLEAVKNKTQLSEGFIKESTGATSKFSNTGVTNAINISQKMAASLGGGVEVPETMTSAEVTDALLLGKLKTLSAQGSVSFRSYTVSKQYASKIGAIYKGNLGDILVSGKGSGYGAMEILYSFKDGKIEKVFIVKNNEVINEHTPNHGDYVFDDAAVTAVVKGKTLSDVKSMKKSDFINDTGASLVYTAEGIQNCTINAFEFFSEKAADYVKAIDDSMRALNVSADIKEG